jgi:cyclic pyranopterin monophosphate synthase
MRLTHQDETGRPRMVDVSGKEITRRAATAEGWLHLGEEAYAALRAGTTPKGDPLVVARIAGIQAAKRTADLIPLCHPLPLSRIDVSVELNERRRAVRVESTVAVEARTGVEMEALTAASVALLAVYDMLKAVDSRRQMRIDDVRLLHRSGGRSGTWNAAGADADDRRESDG